MAELAVAEYFGLQIDTRNSTDPGYDFLIDFEGEHTNLDAKGSAYDDPRLMVNQGSVDSEFYILCRVNLEDYAIDCQQNRYDITQNKIAIDRRSDVGNSSQRNFTKHEQYVDVDLLGWASKVEVLDARAIKHRSSPSHTVPREKLGTIPPPSAVTYRTTGTSRKWDE